MKDKFFKYIHELQDTITSKLEELDSKAQFKEDVWKRPEGGGGRTRVIENGSVLKKAVLISLVFMENYQIVCKNILVLKMPISLPVD